jgi:integrative and conjugative element protein (TIGR02256 family)
MGKVIDGAGACFSLNTSQRLLIAASVLKTFDVYRQTLPWKREAGGQLFGIVTDEKVIVYEASRPHRRDERGRYHFRSHPETARIAIAAAHAKGLLFLGEWHTHAEGKPRPSWEDIQAMRTITARSKLNTSGSLLLIRGTSPVPTGLGAFLFAEAAANSFVSLGGCH